MEKEKIKILPIIISVLLQMAVTLILVAGFALIINLADIDYKYAPVFGSVAVGLGSLAGAMHHSAKKKSKGYLIGLAFGGATFLIVTLIGLILNGGGLTSNTLFHFVIIMLSSLSGGIIGVNKGGKKYI